MMKESKSDTIKYLSNLVETLRERIVSMTSTITELREENKGMAVTIQMLSSNLAKAESKLSHIQRLQDNEAKLRAQIDSLITSLDLAKNDNANLEAECDEMQESIDANAEMLLSYKKAAEHWHGRTTFYRRELRKIV